ncbi:CPBP family intramembrane metalloprotease [Mycoplasmatota bacterium]|nr:CPBP family intramembrane metalloprotease [Mycoplasmatota bacterium]
MKGHKYRTLLYFGLAFAITWINGFILAYQSHNSGSKNMIVLLLAYMGPFIAALIIFAILREKGLFKDFRRRLVNVKLINIRYLPFTLLILPIGMIVSILISVIFGQPIEQLTFAQEFKVFDGEMILSVIILALVPILEELGWRGYGVDSIMHKNNLFRTSIIFGLIWGLWHLPVFFIEGSYQTSLWIMNPIYAINFFVGIIPLVFIMNWLYYKNKRSILLVAVFHVFVNFTSEIFEANQVSKCILTLVLFGVAFVLVKRDPEFFFSKKLEDM